MDDGIRDVAGEAPPVPAGPSPLSGLSCGTLLGAARRTRSFAVRAVRLTIRESRNYPDVPTALPTGPRLGLVFVEELALLAAAAAIDERVLDEDELTRISRDTDAALALFDERGWLDDPVSFHRTPDAPEAVSLTPASSLGTRYRHLRFESGYEPAAGLPGADRWNSLGPNRTCHAFVLEHREGVRPWKVYLHGHSMGRPMDLQLADALHMHRNLGFNVVAVVAPLHGERHVDGEQLISFDWSRNVLALGHCVWDVRRVLAWVRERGAGPIVVHGVSLGGYTAALVAALDPDLAGVIAGVPAAAIYAPMTEILFRNPTIHELVEHAGIADNRMDAIHSVVTPTALPVALPTERLAIYAGLADRLAPPSHPHRLWEHWGRPNILWSPSSHLGTILSWQVRRFVRDAAVRAVETSMTTVA